jgi:hypothetical protein
MLKRFVNAKIENMSSRLLLTKPTLTSILKVCKQKLDIFEVEYNDNLFDFV